VLFVLLVAISSVLLGAALSFVPTGSRGTLGYLRTFATLAAVAVVLTHLLPEALHGLGLWSILLFLLGWFAPVVAHWAGRRTTSGHASQAVLEAGYWGLVVHHVADGIGLGAYARLPSTDGSHLDVVVALAAHTVPLIAVVSLAYRSAFGARSAILRSLGLALASVFGIGLSNLVSPVAIERWAPFIAALAAGLLLHVVTHDLTADTPHTSAGRALDLLVATLGIAVSALGLRSDGDAATWAFTDELSAFVARSALPVLVGWAVVALVGRVFQPNSRANHAFGPARSLSADSVLLSVAWFGFGWSAVRLVPLILFAFLPALAPPLAPAKHEGHHARRSWSARADETLLRAGPWLMLGLLVSALLASAPTISASPHVLGRALPIALLALVANLTPVAAPAAVLISAGLSVSGLSLGAALVFAALAPIVATHGLRARSRVLATALCVALGLAVDAFHLAHLPVPTAPPTPELASFASLALLALFLRGVYQRSARLWVSTVVGAPSHDHAHHHH